MAVRVDSRLASGARRVLWLAAVSSLAACASVCGRSVPTDCAPPCSAGQICCDRECKDPQTDQANCGQCGNICIDQCCSGQCQPFTDPNNCNGCGQACPPPSACKSNISLALTSDPNNRSASCACSYAWKGYTLYRACAAGQQCCPDGNGNLNCTALLTDPANCGSCGNACRSPICIGGRCGGDFEIDVEGEGDVVYASVDQDAAIPQTGTCTGQSPGLTQCPYPQAPIPDGAFVKVTAYPTGTWQFTHWSGACSGTDPSTTYAVVEGLTCTAWFVEPDAGAQDAAADADAAAQADVAAEAEGGSCGTTGSACSDDAGSACCSGTCRGGACCIPQQAKGCVGSGTAGGCCTFDLNRGGTAYYYCEQGTCCVPRNSQCNTTADCCSPYPCSLSDPSINAYSCCQPAGGPCTNANECCILGAAFQQCNNNKCCLLAGYSCNSGGTPNNAACCSGVCGANGGCQ